MKSRSDAINMLEARLRREMAKAGWGFGLWARRNWGSRCGVLYCMKGSGASHAEEHAASVAFLRTGQHRLLTGRKGKGRRNARA